MYHKTSLKRITLFALALLYAFSGASAQGTFLCNEKFSSKKPSGWDILPAYSATAPSWKPDTGICVSASYAMHGSVPYNSGDTATLVTPYFDCTNYEYVMVRFSHICKVLPSDICRIEYQEDVLGSANKWRPIPYDAYKGGNTTYRQDTGFSHSSYSTWADNDTNIAPTNGWWKQETFNMSDYAGYSKVRFRFIIRKGSYLGSFIAAGWYVDDFQVLVSKYELKPPVVEFISNLSDTVYSVGPFTVKAKVASRTAAKIVNPYLAYSVTYEGKTKKDSIRMKAVDGDSIWEADIPQQYYGSQISYSIFGRDVNGNNARANGSFVNKRLKAGKVSGYTYYMPGDTTGATNNNLAIIYHVGYTTSLSRSLYLASEINPKNTPMIFSRLAWYLRPNSTNAGSVKVTRNLKIWMLATTDQTTTTGFMDPVTSGATLVYDDTTVSKTQWNEVRLQKPFALPAGKNLYIFYEGCGGTTSSSSIYWAGHSQSSRCTYNYSGSWSSSTMVPLIRLGMGGGANFDSNSVALASIDNPTEGTIAGKQTVKVSIQNMGDGWLDACQINWTVNGVLQTPKTWTGHLYTDFVDTVTLGSYIQRSMLYDTITVWVSKPNNQVDSVLDDDTLTVIAFGCDSLIKGTYTIGQGGKYNFQNLTDALSILERCGLGGDVTLKLASGTYTEAIKLSNINTSGKYHITITSMADNADSVVFRPKTGPVVSIGSCSGLVFKNLTFDGTKAKPNCVQLTSQLKDIEFSHCKMYGFDTAVSSNTFSNIYRSTGTPIYDIRFIGNEILGGSYGIYFYGSSTTAKNSNILFDSNHIMDYYSYATYFYYNSNIKFTHNFIEGARSGNNYDYGFYAYYTDSGLFDANLVRNRALNSYVYGMRAYYTDSFTVISNNEIVLKNTGTTSYGMYVYYTYGSKVANNSIILNGTATSYGMYVYTGSATYYGTIKNNISVCLSSGTCYPNYFTSTTAASNFDVDYNCWWSKTNVGYVGAAKTSLAAFQSSLPSAVHDLYKQPLFTNSDTSAMLKDNTGLLCTKVRGVDYDRRGMLRVAQTLMGAYTNELPKMNGALTEILNLPGTTMITDTVRPHVVLMNAGTETLTEATIRVELDGVAQGRDLVWKGKLAISEMDTIPIGNFILKTGNHRITAYLTGIGSLKDSIAADDTVHASTFTCSGPMAGSYHVGKNKGDFSTPAEAIRMINLCGISAPVTVSIQSGSYGAVSISGPVAGASSTNTITIIPDAGAKVVIDGGSGTAFSLQNSSHWHFRDITFGNTTNGMVGVELMGDVEDVSFRHCNIYASTSTTSTSYRAVSYPNASGASSYPVDVEFVGNNIQGGYYNMYLYYLAGGTGNMTASSITVDSNVLTDAYYYGIYAYYYSHYKSMSHNTITNRKNSTSVYYGIYNYYYSNVDKMEGNRVHVVTTNTAYGIYWYYYKNYASYGGSAGKFTNNEIMVEGNGGTKYGLYFYIPYQNWEVSHNSIFAKSTSGAVYGIYAYNSNTSYKIELKNNLIVSQSTGTNYPCYLYSTYYTSSYLTLDYNNYVSLNNTNIGYANSTTITSLASWQSTTGMDKHSVNVKPGFKDSTKNFELDNYLPFTCPRLNSVTTDIDGNLRTATTTMGCYGFQINEDVDLQMLAILSPKPITGATCLPTSVPVKISYKNIGMKKADYSHSALKVSVDVTGAISHHFDTTFTKGTLDYKQEDSLTIGQIPTVANGIYRVKVTLTDTSDADNSNDTMSITYKMGRVSLPFDADFSTEPVEIVCATMAGKTNWNVVKGTGSNPAVAPAFGTGRLEFAGENNSGDSAIVVLNGMDLQGCLDPTLSFWYAHSATCSKNDMLTVLVTTDGGANYTEVKRILVADTMTGWKRHDIDLSAFKQASCLSIVLRATSFGGANQSIDRIRIVSVKDATFSLLPIDISGRTACDNTPVDVKAVISNLSKLEVDMLNDTLTLNVSGAVSYSNKVVYNKLLGGFATDTVTLGQISFDANGKYNINAWMQSRDDRSANDTASDSSIFIMQEIALDTVLGFDNQTMKLVGDTVNVNAVVINNGNTTVGQVILHMNINGNEVLADTVSSLLHSGDTLVHPMAYAVPSATKEEPFYFFEMIAELSCDADTSNNTVRMVGQVLIPDSIDIQVLEITTTEQALGNTKLSPSVRIANIGNIYADSVVLHVDVVNDSNRVLESISEVISHMDVNETLNYDFTMTYSVPDYTGKYTLKAFVEAVDGDSIQSNDTLATQFRCYRDSVGIADAEQLDWSLGQNIPNPASAVTAIPFTLPQAGTVRISIMTANGQVIYRQESEAEAGSNRIGIDASGWAAGVYYYTMEYRGQRITRKMNITR